jgi:hypothetical protein
VTGIHWTRSLGDTGPPIDYTCRAQASIGQRYGLPRDLTGTSTIGVVRRWADRAVVASAAATVLGAPSSGMVRLPLTTMISTSPGLHGVSFVVVDSEQRTYPADPLQPEWLLLAAPLGVASDFAPPAPGAPLFLANGAAGMVTSNGQMVFAGASTTVTVAAGVTWFQLAWWDTQTPWTTGTLPTVIQAGATIDPTVTAALLASGGNLVVLTRVGTVFFAAGTGRATIWAFDGAAYSPAPAARLIEQGTTEPAPTGLVDNDIVLHQN